MNIRTFQQRTIVHSGIGSHSLVPQLFQGMNAKRVVIITDSQLVDSGVVKQVQATFASAPAQSTEMIGVYAGIEQDASCSSINRAVQYVREQKADGLLAIGGGSVLDAVKAIKYCMAHEILDVGSAFTIGIYKEEWPRAKPMPIPHISIPTTAGTGSEISPISVIFNEQRKQKMNLIHPYIASDMAVLDPKLTVGLPPFITAFTGFDALTHAIEAFFSPKAYSITDAVAIQAIQLIFKHLPIAVADGQNLSARMEMLYASLMGITAFSYALHAIPIHNLAHAYGALFRIPHGLANSVLLPVVMEHLQTFYEPKMKKLASVLKIDSHHVIPSIRDLQANVGLPTGFSDFQITPDNEEALIQNVQDDPIAKGYPLSTTLIRQIHQQVKGYH
ncbi:iron-containing alcohol dehydrogenase [Hazenella sp. IB182357]|uniref:Iron-containing alcohol dehydrogenase n=1 Tax=Polycladospora coralii TaxID=2771432 RepID=A0A926NDC9_9BACL|nr:iron-containing alcohol dehydrogenase [Polycladospora coralii]MBD1373325.1 iron-containing alcohol dehydrogenase [Polycladospora coralii]